jgi:hypothetical protein
METLTDLVPATSKSDADLIIKAGLGIEMLRLLCAALEDYSLKLAEEYERDALGVDRFCTAVLITKAAHLRERAKQFGSVKV